VIVIVVAIHYHRNASAVSAAAAADDDDNDDGWFPLQIVGDRLTGWQIRAMEAEKVAQESQEKVAELRTKAEQDHKAMVRGAVCRVPCALCALCGVLQRSPHTSLTCSPPLGSSVNCHVEHSRRQRLCPAVQMESHHMVNELRRKILEEEARALEAGQRAEAADSRSRGLERVLAEEKRKSLQLEQRLAAATPPAKEPRNSLVCWACRCSVALRLRCTLLYSTPLHSTLLYSTLLYSTLLYSTLLYSTLLTLLYSTLLYSTLLYSTLLYSTLLYSTLLYSILPLIPLHCTLLRHSSALHTSPPLHTPQQRTTFVMHSAHKDDVCV
jgi:hypothetical protein